jgi:hypothetical protein
MPINVSGDADDAVLIPGAGFGAGLVAMQGRKYVVSLYRIGKPFARNICLHGVQAYRLRE